MSVEARASEQTHVVGEWGMERRRSRYNIRERVASAHRRGLVTKQLHDSQSRRPAARDESTAGRYYADFNAAASKRHSVLVPAERISRPGRWSEALFPRIGAGDRAHDLAADLRR